MKLETYKQPTTEVFVEGKGFNVCAYRWANCEGISVMLHGDGKDLPLRAAFSLRWEELDVLMVALAAARAE